MKYVIIFLCQTQPHYVFISAFEYGISEALPKLKIKPSAESTRPYPFSPKL